MNEEKLKSIYDKCNEKSYVLIKEIETTKDGEKIHLKNIDGYKGVVPIGKFIRGVQDVCWFSNKNPYILDNIRLFLKYHAPNLTLKSESYKSGREYLEFECCYHSIYLSTWENIKSGYNCPKCASDKRVDYKRKSIEDIKRVFEEKGFSLLSTEYKNESEYLDGINSDGYKISVTYASIRNSEPQIFGYKNKYTIDNIKLWLKNNGFSHIELLSDEYIDAHTDLKFYCKKHNEIIYATWNNVSKGKICYKCGLEKRSGENSPRYNPNLTDEERKLKRNYPEYTEWRNEVFKRDNYTCIISGVKRNIVAHHLNSYNWYKEGRTDINNGITISVELHKEFHEVYGYGNNTKEQFIEFINNKGLEIALP